MDANTAVLLHEKAKTAQNNRQVKIISSLSARIAAKIRKNDPPEEKVSSAGPTSPAPTNQDEIKFVRQHIRKTCK
ncbi:Oidioi.mRNA.OKI2018_I69.XSR.g13577.t1.cds [Oikopleura dioica]|uniref:Oidioi.mRNA.OKI2018_I69.XSR.g13577.t1.cds n=1 Tax=Oikopleura dioica TaxID=34765 RepID=A0ABN7S7A5_OIKDI|nr:Oidioi.mRNA.OKI2018_I69.XSR.g13577.t1.cds [Oikopleura dioica]